jgi:hypothetical protein
VHHQVVRSLTQSKYCDSTQFYFAPHCKSVPAKIGLCPSSWGFNQTPQRWAPQ